MRKLNKFYCLLKYKTWHKLIEVESSQVLLIASGHVVKPCHQKHILFTRFVNCDIATALIKNCANCFWLLGTFICISLKSIFKLSSCSIVILTCLFCFLELKHKKEKRMCGSLLEQRWVFTNTTNHVNQWPAVVEKLVSILGRRERERGGGGERGC